MKAGVAGEDMPRAIVPSLSGYVGEACYVGQPALMREGLKVKCPIDPRHDIDWDALADMWEYMLCGELRINPNDHPLLMSEVPQMNQVSREKMAEVMFESFDVPALHIGSPAVLSLYAQGLVTGITVDCGNRLQIVPVVDGFVIDSAINKSRHGFAGLTEYLARLLTGRGYFYNTAKQMEVVRKVKEAKCYVALNYEAEMKRKASEVEASYELVDGTVVTLGQERFQCPEAMFQPEMLGLDMEGVHKMLWKSISKCPIDTRKPLLSNIVVTGGSTLFPGFEKRLEAEIFASATSHGQNLRRSDVKLFAPRNRKYLAWFGGAVLGSIDNFVDDNCLTREQYLEGETAQS